MADKARLPAVAGTMTVMRCLIGAVGAVVILFGAVPASVAAATPSCGRVITYVAPNSAGALNNGDGWLIFMKPDGTSEKVIVRSGTLTPTGEIGGYVCIASDGLYFDGLLAPGTAGYVPEPASWVTGTGVYCGIVAVNPFTAGQLSGPRTFQLGGTLTGMGIFRVPVPITLPTIGSYLCGRFKVGGPSQLVTVLLAGDPGYVAGGLPNTSTAPAKATPTLTVAGLLLFIGLALVALNVRRRTAT